jgi:hypothetical protein
MSIAQREGRLPPFTWIVVLQVPASPANFAVCMYFVPSSPSLSNLFQHLRDDEADAQLTQALREENNLPPDFVQLMQAFFFGNSDEYRNDRFKMVPCIRDGPFLVRKAVPSNKPALIGRRLPIRYFRTESYMEMDIDIGGGTSTAKNLTQMSVGFSSSVKFDCAFVIEGRTPRELPEEVLGVGSLMSVNLASSALALDLSRQQ